MPSTNPLLAMFQGWVLATYSRLVHRTSTIEIKGWEHVEAALALNRPIIFVNWHGQIHLAYCAFASRVDLSDVLLVIVGDWRQGLLEAFARFAGAAAFPVDMGDSSMAAARSLLALIKQLKPGKFSYFSPDGPDGPAHIAKPGIAFIAERADAVLLPIASRARHALHVPRWDRYTLPLPFTRIRTVIGPGIISSKYSERVELMSVLTRELNLSETHVQEDHK